LTEILPPQEPEDLLLLHVALFARFAGFLLPLPRVPWLAIAFSSEFKASVRFADPVDPSSQAKERFSHGK
jgi:hypothetical protein